jgi:hypothetical protein
VPVGTRGPARLGTGNDTPRRGGAGMSVFVLTPRDQAPVRRGPASPEARPSGTGTERGSEGWDVRVRAGVGTTGSPYRVAPPHREARPSGKTRRGVARAVRFHTGVGTLGSPFGEARLTWKRGTGTGSRGHPVLIRAAVVHSRIGPAAVAGGRVATLRR